MVSKINFIEGNNFSGRSNFAQEKCDESLLSSKRAIYISEIPSNNITGIMPTVFEELKLHEASASKESKFIVNLLIDNTKFKKHFDKNPFSLSGGEQVMLVLMTSILLDPDEIYVDLLTEQLNRVWLTLLFNVIQKNHSKSIFYFIDNRFEEYDLTSMIIKPNHLIKDFDFIFKDASFISSLDYRKKGGNLRIDNLSFAYNRKNQVYLNFSFEFRRGNVYHLRGENGSGKSTLGKLLTGILKLQSGKILLDNKEVDTYKYPGKHVSYHFQNPDEQLFAQTVKEEIFGADSNKVSEIKRMNMTIEQFGISDILDVNPAELPFVMRKRVALASSVFRDCDWYILDEPTLGQDQKFVEFLRCLIGHLVIKGKGIILISHSNNFTKTLNVNNLYLSEI